MVITQFVVNMNSVIKAMLGKQFGFRSNDNSTVLILCKCKYCFIFKLV